MTTEEQYSDVVVGGKEGNWEKPISDQELACGKQECDFPS